MYMSFFRWAFRSFMFVVVVVSHHYRIRCVILFFLLIACNLRDRGVALPPSTFLFPVSSTDLFKKGRKIEEGVGT